MGSNELVQDPQKLLQLLLTAVFQVLSHAGAQVLVDQLPGKTVQGASGGSGLHQNIRAVHVLFHHAPDAPDLALDAVQPGDEVLVLLLGALKADFARLPAALDAALAGRQLQPVLPSAGAQQGSFAGAGEQWGQLPSGILFTSLMSILLPLPLGGILLHNCIIARRSCFCK